MPEKSAAYISCYFTLDLVISCSANKPGKPILIAGQFIPVTAKMSLIKRNDAVRINGFTNTVTVNNHITSRGSDWVCLAQPNHVSQN